MPATQIGVKIPISDESAVGQIHAIMGLFIPGAGCLRCNELIDPTELAIDMHPDQERAAARYVPGVPAPSVIALNGLAAMEAVNQFMFAVTGLHDDPEDVTWTIHLPRGRERAALQPCARRWCSVIGQCGRGRE